MSRALRFTAATLASLILSGCVGYQLGGAKPSALANVRSIAVPMFENQTLEPRVGVLATNATVSALTADGTYRIKTMEDADSILEATVTEVDYIQIRANRIDTLRPTELQNNISIDWKLTDSRTNRVLDQGTTIGTSRLFLDSNLQTSRTNALPDAVRNAARSIASRLGDGF